MRTLRLGSLALGERPLVVAAGGESEVAALATVDAADAVELRADLFADPEPARIARDLAHLRKGGRPVILTARAAVEGGKPLDEARRRALYDVGLAHADAIDLEIASTALVTHLVPRAHAAGRLVILSAHVLDRTPPANELLPLVEQADARGADVTKLATHANGLDDLRTLLAVTLAARPRGIVTLAMGPATGPLSRIVLPAAGSLLTYGHVGRATAPGQLAVGELAALVRRFF